MYYLSCISVNFSSRRFFAGAGFAGGIVSAAVDGLLVGNAIKSKFYANEHEDGLFNSGKASVGFEY